MTTFEDPLDLDARDADVAAAWESLAFADSEDRRAARELLITRYAPLVTQVATRMIGRLPDTVELADLVSYGMFGLIDAIEKFELDRGFKFETYASTRVRGAIIDELRAADWVPRSVRAKARAVETVDEVPRTGTHAQGDRRRCGRRARLGVARGEDRSRASGVEPHWCPRLDEPRL